MPVVRKIVFVLFVWLGLNAGSVSAARFMEKLDRGVAAVYRGGGQVYVGWRMLGTEPASVAYNIYRNGVKVNASPIADSTNFLDTGSSLAGTYRVAAVIDGVEQSLSEPVGVWSDFYHDIPLQVPAGGTTPDGVSYTYSPNDASVGDVDGDGQYEIILKWDPSNSKDNAHSGYTGNVYLDAYEMDGTFLWRIDLGINIRAGAHYTQFIVYDFDSDGRAEVACKTADGTTDGQGNVLGEAAADWRNSAGRILDGPEYLSIFDGQTGAFLDTVNYVPGRGNVSAWGDDYGNRVDRFLACAAYLDGVRPSLVMCRGYYTRTVLAAWDFRDGQLVQRWVFDSDNGYRSYAGQGNHNLSVADADGDGKDEIIYGACAIDDDGTGLHTTGLGHGDALHVSDMDPDRPGLEVWMPHEGSATGATYRDAATGEILINHYNSGDVGRGCAGHVDARYVGYQLWSHATGGTYTVDGTQISTNMPNLNFLVWWTGDLQRELLYAVDGNGRNPALNKWGGDGAYRLLSLYSIPTSYSTNSNNGTKGNACLTGDLLGDWREEMIFRSSDNTKLRIFTTTELTGTRIYTLMHDPQYRLAMAWQNVAYNQPPHPGFYIGAGMEAPPAPDIITAGIDPDETEPPSPSPMGWARKPFISGHNAIGMQAAAAFDPSGVEYYFECTFGDGHDSGWQESPYYEDTGLTAGEVTTYTVRARDKSPQRNTTFASVPASGRAVDPAVAAYWNFEDGAAGAALSSLAGGGSVDVVNGIVMRGYNATYGPSFATQTLTGVGLGAYCNGGQDGYTTDAELNGWSPQQWTIEVSVRLDDVSGWETVIGRDGSTSGTAEADFYLQRNGADGAFRLNYYSVGGARHVLDGDFAVEAGRWCRLAVTSDGATITMYCDRLDGSGFEVAGTLDVSAYSAAQNAPAAGGFNWTFGRGWFDGDFTDHITGAFDDVRFTSRALSPEELLGTPWEIPWTYGDFTGDHVVDLDDFSVLSTLWLWEDCGSLGEFDVDQDCAIGMGELGATVEQWLMGK